MTPLKCRLFSVAVPMALSIALGSLVGSVPVWAQEGADLSAPVTPQGATSVVPLGRLSDAVRPTAYRLDLTIDPAQPRFSGTVEIDVDISDPTSVVYLHGKRLHVAKVRATVEGKTVEGEWREVDASGVVRLTFSEALPKGRATLAFVYDAAFVDGPEGMFRLDVGGAWYSWTHFQSTDARAAFPCFDQPGFKTPYSVTIRTPQGLKAITNAPEQGTVDLEKGLEVHRFAQTLPLPTYLVAMMVGPFAKKEDVLPSNAVRSHDLPIAIATTAQNADQMDFALDGTKAMMPLLEEYFGEAFPFPKMDQVSTPLLRGGMENAGAALYRDDLLVMGAQSPVVQQRNFGMVVAHELAHQWFGDLVTPEWWDDLWLNESFANWMGYRIGGAWRPDLGIAGDAFGAGYQAMEIDALLAGRPIKQPILKSSEIETAFDPITYGKGGHVVGMIAAWLGEEKFREGVRQYIAQHRLGTATSEDFFKALAQVAGAPRLVPAMRSFVEQQGVPLLAVRQLSGGRVMVTQLRYTTAGVAPPPARWVIPICFRRGGKRSCFIMDQVRQTFTVEGNGPVFPNAGGTGYYRFELTATHWQDLIRGAAQLPDGEALALVDSLWASVRGGRGLVVELAKLANNLIRHPDPHAADASDKAMSRLMREGILGSQARRGFRLLRERLYRPLLKEYGFDPRAGVYAHEPPARSQRRSQVVSALVSTNAGRSLREQMEKAATAYLGGDKSALDETWFDHALDLYLVARGEAGARDLVDRALASEDPVFRPEGLGAAARFGTTAITAWLLGLEDPRLRATERLYFLDGAMSRRSTREYGYAWALANVDAQLMSGDGQTFARRLPDMLGRFCSVTWAERISSDFKSKLAGTPGELELDRAIERVRNCGLLDDMMGFEIDADFRNLR